MNSSAALMRWSKLSWGRWHLRAENYTLWTKAGGYIYEIDLEKCTDSAHVLDWLAQMAHKRWMTSSDLGNLLRALSDLLGLQENVCGSGQDHRIDPVVVITKRLPRLVRRRD